MTSTFGRNLRITIFGEAKGPVIGITCDGLPAGLPVDPSVMEKALLKRRAYGDWSEESRKESENNLAASLQTLKKIAEEKGIMAGTPVSTFLANLYFTDEEIESLVNRLHFLKW